MGDVADIHQKKAQLLAAYSGDSWSRKVKNMSDNQILAVWFAFKKQGKIN